MDGETRKYQVEPSPALAWEGVRGFQPPLSRMLAVTKVMERQARHAGLLRQAQDKFLLPLEIPWFLVIRYFQTPCPPVEDLDAFIGRTLIINHKFGDDPLIYLFFFVF